MRLSAWKARCGVSLESFNAEFELSEELVKYLVRARTAVPRQPSLGRFVPKEDIAQTLWYCLAATQEKYEVQLYYLFCLSYHYHIVLTDVAAQLPDFMRDLSTHTCLPGCTYPGTSNGTRSPGVT